MTNEVNNDSVFGEVISVYTRKQAIEDGVLVDANIGDLAEVTAQHFKVPVAMTSAVWALIDKAVKNERAHNDVKGVWHDICGMARMARRSRRGSPTEMLFRVIITGTGRQRLHTLKVVCGPMDDGSACLTFMLPEED